MNTVTDDVGRIRDALACIPADVPRDEWARIGAALKHELGDGGFDLFDAWSQSGESYNAADARSTWRSLSAGGGITINTLFFVAIEHGFDSRGGASTVDAAEMERRRAEREQRAVKEVQEREMKAKSAAGIADAVWRAASPARADHPYLVRKGVQLVDTLREIEATKLAALIGYQPKRGDDLLAGRIVIAPVKVGGKLSTLEMIDADGRKSALAGGTKAGGYWAAQKLPDALDVVLIAEGVATALSASQCAGYPAIASLSVGQMEAAARAMRERYPDAALVMLADLDKATGEPHPTAMKAAQSLGAHLALPDFGGDRRPDQTDFNDMHAAHGADAVKAAIEVALSAGSLTAPADDAPAETDEQAIERLAALKPMQYDRVRKAEAKRMGVQVATLDRLIAAERADGDEGDGSPFDTVEPWHEPVDGVALLDELVCVVHRFIVCDAATGHGTALWITMTWLMDSVDVAPIAAITAPEKRCGKSQLLFLMGRLSSRPLAASNITPAALFRAIEAWRPTLLIDEADAFMRENEELRGLLNCGHTRDSAYVVRTVGDDHMPKQFFVWGAKAIAGIGHLADTLMDRSVTLELRRKLSHEQVDKLRHAEPGMFERLRAKLARWADDNEDAVRAARPALPEALHDRAADNWEPLLQIAEVAGGTWPETARRAALKLSGSAEQSQSTGAELLADIQEVFDTRKVQRIFSADLLAYLCDDEEKPWATWNRGKPMALKQLGTRLGEYGIKSAQIRIGYESKKGYLRSQFDDAFGRYLSSRPVTPLSPETSKQPNTGAGLSVSHDPKRFATESPSETLEPLLDKACFDVSDRRGETPEGEKCVTGHEAEDEL